MFHDIKHELVTYFMSRFLNSSAHKAYVRLKFARANWLNILSIVTGWAYFVFWSLSYYPQVIVNYRRHCVRGLSFDFVAVNIVGYAAYSIFNAFLFWMPSMHELYEEKNPRSEIPVGTRLWKARPVKCLNKLFSILLHLFWKVLSPFNLCLNLPF